MRSCIVISPKISPFKSLILGRFSKTVEIHDRLLLLCANQFSSSKKRKILCHVTNVMQPVFVFLRNELYHYSTFSVVVLIYVYVFVKKNHRNMRPWLQKHLSLSLWSHFFPTEASTASAFPRSGCTKQFFSFSHLIPLLNAFNKDLEVETLRITYKKICRLEASS